MNERARRGWLGVALVCVGALWAEAGPAQLPMHEDWHQKLRAGVKMEVVRAGYFGSGGAEAFSGVVVLGSGREAAVYGNSWGPPFPGDTKVTVMGEDHLADVPLQVPGMQRDGKGRTVLALGRHPNKTGFVVRYAADLSGTARVARFGWGVATVDAGVGVAGGGLVVAGRSSEHFAGIATACQVGGRRKPAADPERCFGPLVYEGVKRAADVYVGKLNEGWTGFEWVWVLEGYREGPNRLHVAADGSIVFESHREVFRVKGDGTACETLAVLGGAVAGENIFLGGVNAKDGSLLVAGSRAHTYELERHLGIEVTEVLQPALDVLGTDGKSRVRTFNWPASLAANRRLGRGASCGIVAADCLADGRVAYVGESRGTNTLLETSPVDLTRSLGRGVWVEPPDAPRSAGREAALRATVAVVDPAGWTNGVCSAWVAMEGPWPADVKVQGVRGLRDGRVAIWGESGRWLLQTGTEVFRSAEHTKWEKRAESREVGGPGEVVGVGGEGPFLTVFDRDLSGVAWSSALPGCRVAGVGEVEGGLLVVSGCEAGGGNQPPATGTSWTKHGGGLSDGHVLLLGKLK